MLKYAHPDTHCTDKKASKAWKQLNVLIISRMQIFSLTLIQRYRKEGGVRELLHYLDIDCMAFAESRNEQEDKKLGRTTAHMLLNVAIVC